MQRSKREHYAGSEGIVRYHFTREHRSPPITLVVHGSSNLAEASNIGTTDEGRELALGRCKVLLGGAQAVLEAVLHDGLKLGVNLLRGPRQALRVLGHFETGDGDTSGVGSLSGSVPDGLALLLATVRLEDVNGLLCAAHVGALGDELGARLDESLGLVLGDLVLGR